MWGILLRGGEEGRGGEKRMGRGKGRGCAVVKIP